MGGLGIKKMQPMNLAFMTKLGWRLREDKNSLCAQVLQDKYSRNDLELKPKKGSSNVWKRISKCTKFLEKGSKKVIRNGKTISFWLDIWLGNEPLENSLFMVITLEEKHKKACDYWIKGEG